MLLLVQLLTPHILPESPVTLIFGKTLLLLSNTPLPAAPPISRSRFQPLLSVASLPQVSISALSRTLSVLFRPLFPPSHCLPSLSLYPSLSAFFNLYPQTSLHPLSVVQSDLTRFSVPKARASSSSFPHAHLAPSPNRWFPPFQS